MTCPNCDHDNNTPPLSPYADDAVIKVRLEEILDKHGFVDALLYHESLCIELMRYVMEGYHAGFQEGNDLR